jgi:hypothetical protein
MKAQVTEDAAGLHFEIKDDGSAEYKKAAGIVAAIIQTDANGKVGGIRHQERDDFPPSELIPLYLCPQLAISDKEQAAIKTAIEWLTTLSSRRREIHSADLLLQDARTLRGLLDRVK